MSVDIDIEQIESSASTEIQEAFAAFDEEQIRALVAYAFKQLYVSEETELSLAVASEAEMERIHIEWMDLTGPTDVMSFPMDEMIPGTPEELSQGVLGDIILCPMVAAYQAKNAGHSILDEFCLLTVHGILHCLGYDHGTADEEAEMFGMQREILEGFLGRSAPVETRF
ncbi:MAG: rRNA maturation RNase YbeY [Rothia sp. (in: high G+C Gram-positive bacteria)]|nr:rRNA maturation RNase YbeY [Rothia sp. (in: high G+C Gram-positive bacteria)]